MNKREERLYYIDFIKIIGILLIINSHMDSVYPIKAIATGGALGNALFFISSGVLLRNINMNHNFWKKFMLKIYIPTEIMILLTFQGVEDDFFYKYVWPTEYWFIGAILLFYLLYFMIRRHKLFANPKIILILIAIVDIWYYIVFVDKSFWSIEIAGIKGKIGFYKLIYYFAIMYSGGVLVNYKAKYKKSFYGIISAISVIFLYLTKFLMVKIPILLNIQIICQVEIYIFAIAFLVFARLLFEEIDVEKHKKTKYLLSNISKYSLAIYLTQFVAISIAKEVIFPMSWILSIVLIVIFSIVLKYISDILLSFLERTRGNIK